MIFKRYELTRKDLYTFLRFLGTVYSDEAGYSVKGVMYNKHPLKPVILIGDVPVMSALEGETGYLRKIWDYESFWGLCKSVGFTAIVHTHASLPEVSGHHVEIIDIKSKSYNCDGCLMDCKHTGIEILAPYPGDDGVMVRLCPSCAYKFKESFNKVFTDDSTKVHEDYTQIEEYPVSPVKINFWARLKRLIGICG